MRRCHFRQAGTIFRRRSFWRFPLSVSISETDTRWRMSVWPLTRLRLLSKSAFRVKERFRIICEKRNFFLSFCKRSIQMHTFTVALTSWDPISYHLILSKNRFSQFFSPQTANHCGARNCRKWVRILENSSFCKWESRKNNSKGKSLVFESASNGGNCQNVGDELKEIRN